MNLALAVTLGVTLGVTKTAKKWVEFGTKVPEKAPKYTKIALSLGGYDSKNTMSIFRKILINSILS